MPIKNIETRRLKQKLQKQRKRIKIYEKQDALTVVSPKVQIKNRDGTNSMFTFMPVMLTKKDELTLHKLITKNFL